MSLEDDLADDRELREAEIRLIGEGGVQAILQALRIQAEAEAKGTFEALRDEFRSFKLIEHREAHDALVARIAAQERQITELKQWRDYMVGAGRAARIAWTVLAFLATIGLAVAAYLRGEAPKVAR